MAPVSVMEPQLAVADYFAAASRTDRFGERPDGITQLGFGLFGEVGGLLAGLKKFSRDKLLETEAQLAGEELGDALWYLCWRRSKFDPPCRLNFDPGLGAGIG